MSIHVNTTLQTTTFITYSTNGKGNSCEDSNEAGTAPPNVEVLAQPAAVHVI